MSKTYFSSDAAEVVELSEPEFKHHADRADISTFAVFFSSVFKGKFIFFIKDNLSFSPHPFGA